MVKIFIFDLGQSKNCRWTNGTSIWNEERAAAWFWYSHFPANKISKYVPL